MAFVSQLLVLAHLVSAIMLIGGLFGRELTRVQAAKNTNIDLFTAFIEHSGRCRNCLIPDGDETVLDVMGFVLLRVAL